MKDTEKTREQLLEELADLRRSIAEMQDQRNELASGNSVQLNESKYAALFENSLVPILLTVPDGRILDANDAACRMFGRTKEELCQLGRDGVVEADDSHVAKALEERKKRGSWSGELILKRSDGTIFPAEVASQIFHDSDGTQKNCLVIRDITDKKRAEEALRSSEIRYRALFENMRNAVAVYGAERDGEDLVILDFNRAAEQIEQVSKDQVIGRSILKVFPGVQGFGLFEVFQRVWKTGRAEYYPVTFYKDQRIAGWRDNFVYRLPSGEIVAVYSDETERKNAEYALQRSEGRFRNIVEIMSDWVWEVDESGLYTYISPKIREVLGYEPEEALGRTPFDFMTKEEASRVSKIFESIAASRKPFSFLENTNVSKDGRTVVLETSGVPIFGLNGEFEGYRGVDRDITERKRNEAALRESEERFRIAADFSYNWEYWADTNGSFVYVSPSCERITGYSREEFMKNSNLLEEIVYANDKDFFREHISNAEAGCLPSGSLIEFRIIDKSGDIHWIEHVCQKVFSDSGESLGRRASLRDVTARKNVEEELRKAEEILRLMVEHSPLAMLVSKELSREIEYMNSRLTELFGYSMEDLSDVKNWWTLAYPDEDYRERVSGEWSRRMEIAMRDRASIEPLETEVTCKDDSKKIIEWGLVSAGSRNVIFGIDLTARKNAERALRESEGRFQAFMENSPMAAFAKDDQGRFVYGNEKWLSMHDLIDKDWQGKTAEQILPPELAAKFTETDAIAFTQNRLFEYVVPFPNADGSLSHWLAYKFPFRDAEGRLYVGGAAIDISLQIQALEALKQSERELRQRTEELKTLLDAQPAMVLFAHDPKCRVITGNQTANEVLGVPADTNVSQTAEEKPQVIPIKRLRADGTEYRPDELPLQRAAATGKPVLEEEFEYRFSDGSQMFLRGNAVPLFDAQGGVRGAVAVFLDITKLKQGEQERETLRIQLLQSQKMEAIGTLAACIAHDFNNMLQVILGYSDLLLLGKKPGEPGYAELQKIIKTSYDARDLVQKIRLVSRRADIHRKPLELNPHVKEVSELLAQTLPRNITIETHLTENPATINADPELMKQMVMNLGINAGEAMPEGGTLTIKTENKVLDTDFCRKHPGLEPGLHVLLTVSDTGRGISPDVIDRLFDPFYSTKERDYHKGTGLGLPVVRGIVEMHKGCIDVESELGRGTTVRIYLPIMEVIEEPKKVEEIEQPLGGTETILLVEDEDLVRNLGVYALEQFGYKVLATVDGQEALEVYKREKERISLVILDIIMPRMDGKQCFKELLRMNPNVKVLVSSGVIQRELIQEVVNLGAKGSLVKPFNVTDLLRKVREVIDAD